MEDGAADWDEADRNAWVGAYLAGLPVQLPLPEHGVGTCSHCDALRTLVARVEQVMEELSTAYSTPN